MWFKETKKERERETEREIERAIWIEKRKKVVTYRDGKREIER